MQAKSEFRSSLHGFQPVFNSAQGLSRKSRNFSGVFRVTQFSLFLQNEGVSRHENLHLFLFLFALQHMKRRALQNKHVVVLRMAFRARKVSGTFEKRAPEPSSEPWWRGCLEVTTCGFLLDHNRFLLQIRLFSLWCNFSRVVKCCEIQTNDARKNLAQGWHDHHSYQPHWSNSESQRPEKFRPL